MQLLDNINSLLGDDLKRSLKPHSRLMIAAASFSIYAYEALKRELENVDSLEFIFTQPAFIPDEATDSGKRVRREFHIPKIGRERDFYGAEFEIQPRNKTTQRAIARECAGWLRRKAHLRSNSGGAPMQQFAVVQARDPAAVYMQSGTQRAVAYHSPPTREAVALKRQTQRTPWTNSNSTAPI